MHLTLTIVLQGIACKTYAHEIQISKFEDCINRKQLSKLTWNCKKKETHCDFTLLIAHCLLLL
jgi:hypothetical protein